MTGRPLAVVVAPSPADVLREALREAANAAAVAAAAPADAWLPDDADGGRAWTLDRPTNLPLRLVAVSPGRLCVAKGSGIVVEMPVADGLDAGTLARLPAAAVAAVAAALPDAGGRPDWTTDWLAVAAHLDRTAGAGRRIPADTGALVRLPTPWSPTTIEPVRLRLRAGAPDHDDLRTLPAAHAARFDAACPAICSVAGIATMGVGGPRLVVAPIAATCAPGSGSDLVAGLDPVGLLRAIARVRAAGGLA